MMFGVGLHFKWQDLMNVKNIAIPGAVIQIVVTALITTLAISLAGWTVKARLLVGLAIGVASTVVLVRVLTDNKILNTPEGHICVGWLIVEDLITVIALLVVPELAAGNEISMQGIALSILFALLKFLLLAGLMFTIGRACVTYAFPKVIHTKSNELFTVTILAFTFVIATGSALFFGTSIALGAFIAGMVIGQTNVRKQVSINAMPLKDAFVVIFFVCRHDIQSLCNYRSFLSIYHGFDYYYNF